MYEISLIHLRIKSRQTSQHLQIGNHTKSLKAYFRSNKGGQVSHDELKIKGLTASNTSASNLDLFLFIRKDGQLFTSLYYRRGDFNGNITTFSFLSIDISSLPAYCVSISQLIRYARACSSHECIILRAMRLSYSLFGQGYVKERLKLPLRKFCCRHMDRIKPYEIPLFRAKQKYRGVFETQESGNKTSSGEIGIDIRTHACPEVGQDQVSGGVSVICWHTASVANVLCKPHTIR